MKKRILRTIGVKELVETVVAAVVFASIVAVVLVPVTDAVGPWVA